MTKRQQRRSKEPPVEAPFSPFTPWEYHRFLATIFRSLGLIGLIKSGIRPGPNDPKAWYDRAIRVVGGSSLIVVGSVLVVMMVEGILKL
jgi:hypothetical protein